MRRYRGRAPQSHGPESQGNEFVHDEVGSGVGGRSSEHLSVESHDTMSERIIRVHLEVKRHRHRSHDMQNARINRVF